MAALRSFRRSPRGLPALACLALVGLSMACLTVGCDRAEPSIGRLDLVWGRRGLKEGRFQKPRAITIDDQDQLYIVDMMARIQVFDADGEFIRSWQTPEHDRGRPTGMSIDSKGRLLVADTHYYRVLIYSLQGELLQTIGGTRGNGPGEFGFLTDIAEDSQGCLYVAEYGEYDRIQKFTPEGKHLLEWGGHGSEPGQFLRPQSVLVDEQDRVWVADACNHRIQIFDTRGKLLRMWGTAGSAPGELYYPYGMVFDDDGNLYICEYGNHRVQKFNRAGESLGCWGHEGRGEGELYNPWALVRDQRGRIHVLDSNNHRVQRVVM